MSVVSYRPDIDGLRAIAVLTVIFFHMGIAGFSGGFVGVDIFFVISGFLITSLIKREIQMGEFSIASFWLRRARRILPAMFVVIAFTLIAGWFLLAPNDYFSLGRSARYQALFGANIFFWKEAGYFDTAAELKPLLHTWSLAVEEQFYLIFPWLLLGLKNRTESQRLLLLLSVTLISFVISIELVSEDPPAAYYLLHSRAWQLLAGGLIAFLPYDSRGMPRLSAVVGYGGLLALLAAVMLYDDTTPFPGLAALLPTLGAVAIIWAGPSAAVSRVLSWRPLVFIGLLSYSLYLWHWPLIVFAKYWYPEKFDGVYKVWLLLATFLAAWMSWKFIEQPIRKKKLLPTPKKVVGVALASTVLLVLAGQWIRIKEGYPERLPEDVRNYALAERHTSKQQRCLRLKPEDIAADKLCRLGENQRNSTPVFLTWGDSHANALLSVFDQLSDEFNLTGWHAARSECPPVLNLSDLDPGCLSFNREMFEAIKRHRIPHVILVGRWSLYLHGEQKKSETSAGPPPSESTIRLLEQSIAQTLTELRALGVTVWVVKQVPLQDFDPPHTLTLLALRGKSTEHLGKSFAEHMARQHIVEDIFSRIEADNAVNILDPTPFFCEDQKRCIVAKDGHSLYRDDDHLSSFGAIYLKDMFKPMIRRVKET